MKIQRNDLKAVIKECLKELISEGALNNTIANLINNQGIPMTGMGMQPMQQNMQALDPRIQAVANSMAKNGNDQKLYEAIFADSLGTVAQQSNADPLAMMNNQMNQGMNFNPGMNNFFQQGFSQQPQQMMPQYAPQMPMQPMQQNMMGMMQPQQGMPQMLHQNPQAAMANQMSQGAQPSKGWISRWAELAMSKPISNRPSSEGGFGGEGSGPPGSNMGSFG